jgi:hypothetical protein
LATVVTLAEMEEVRQRLPREFDALMARPGQWARKLSRDRHEPT